MEFDTFQLQIMKWAEERGIYQYSTPRAQLLKLISEVGELADAEIKNNHAEILDAIGDILVCLVNYAAMKDISIHESMYEAWAEIKDRKGTMVPGGAFVKEE